MYSISINKHFIAVDHVCESSQVSMPRNKKVTECSHVIVVINYTLTNHSYVSATPWCLLA